MGYGVWQTFFRGQSHEMLLRQNVCLKSYSPHQACCQVPSQNCCQALCQTLCWGGGPACSQQGELILVASPPRGVSWACSALPGPVLSPEAWSLFLNRPSHNAWFDGHFVCGSYLCTPVRFSHTNLHHSSFPLFFEAMCVSVVAAFSLCASCTLGSLRVWQSPTAYPGFRLSQSSLRVRSATTVICGIIIELDSSEP